MDRFTMLLGMFVWGLGLGIAIVSVMHQRGGF